MAHRGIRLLPGHLHRYDWWGYGDNANKALKCWMKLLGLHSLFGALHPCTCPRHAIVLPCPVIPPATLDKLDNRVMYHTPPLDAIIATDGPDKQHCSSMPSA